MSDEHLENDRRSVKAIARDRLVIRALLDGPATVERLAARLDLKRPGVYASIAQLKKRNYVEKQKTDSRTPTWSVTELGAGYVAQLPEGQPELPPVPPEPEPVEEPVAEQPTEVAPTETPEPQPVG